VIYLAIILQLAFGFLIGYGGTWSVQLESFREIFVFSIGSVLGVWGVGSIFKEARMGGSAAKEHLLRFINTLMGSSFGALLVIQVNTIDITDDFILPLVGAVVGYYYPSLGSSKSDPQR